MHTRIATTNYRLEEDRFGNFLLTHLADGTSCYFQGDDAALWRWNMAQIEAVKYKGPNSLEGSFDLIASGYEGVLTHGFGKPST